MAVPLLTISIEDLEKDDHKQIYEIVYKWIIDDALPQLNNYRDGFLTIGTDLKNKHLLLDFIEK